MPGNLGLVALSPGTAGPTTVYCSPVGSWQIAVKMTEFYEFVFNMAGYFCHQMPERSFFIGGAQFPLCIRCVALLAGGLGAFAFLLARIPLPQARLCLLMVLPMTIDLSLSFLGIIESGNLQRAATALLFGFFFLMGSLRWLAEKGDRYFFVRETMARKLIQREPPS